MGKDGRRCERYWSGVGRSRSSLQSGIVKGARTEVARASEREKVRARRRLWIVPLAFSYYINHPSGPDAARRLIWVSLATQSRSMSILVCPGSCRSCS